MSNKNITRRKVVAGIGLGVAATAVAGSAALWSPYVSLIPGRSRARAIASDPKLPAQADAVVIGGGDTGVAAALCLAERGLSVAICEKGVIGGEASCRSNGVIESMHLNPAKAQLTLRAKELWAGLNARIGGDTGYRRTGLLETLQTEEQLAAATDWVKSVAGQPGLDPRIVRPREVLSLYPDSERECLAVLYQPSEATAEPRWIAPAIALGARAKGATIHQQCAVRGIETSAGRVSAVVTERGIIRTGIAILAGGVWSPLFAGNLGLTLPQLYTFASNQSVAPLSAAPLITGGWGRSSWRMEPDGGYTVGLFAGITPVGWETFRFGLRYWPALRHMSEINIGVGQESWRSLTLERRWQLDQRTPFEETRILEPTPRIPVLDQSLREVVGALPAFKNARVRERYAGALCTTPDNMPVISSVGAIPGLLMGTGIYYGLTIAPAAGELLADLATGTTPRVDPRPYRYERLIDGTRLTFQP